MLIGANRQQSVCMCNPYGIYTGPLRHPFGILHGVHTGPVRRPFGIVHGVHTGRKLGPWVHLVKHTLYMRCTYVTRMRSPAGGGKKSLLELYCTHNVHIQRTTYKTHVANVLSTSSTYVSKCTRPTYVYTYTATHTAQVSRVCSCKD